MAKREPAQRERGTGRVYQQRDPQHPGRTLQVWWIDYSVDAEPEERHRLGAEFTP